MIPKKEVPHGPHSSYIGTLGPFGLVRLVGIPCVLAASVLQQRPQMAASGSCRDECLGSRASFRAGGL